MNAVAPALARCEENFSGHTDDLKRLVRIPSVSFADFDPARVENCAEAVAGLLRERGIPNVELLRLPGTFPYVYGEFIQDVALPTLLLYAHYDVQPPGREEVWLTKPFEPEAKQGPGGLRLYGRGTADDKAGIIVHTAAIASYLEAAGRLPVNVKLVIEGEEEIGSPHLADFLEACRDKVRADVMVLTDTANHDCGVPTLTVGLRGLAGLDVEVRALKKTIHSGMWGGPIPDPAMALAVILAGMVDEDGGIAIPAIRAMVPELTQARRASLTGVPFSAARFREQAGLVPGARLLDGGDGPLARLWFRPSLTVNAIQASSRKQAGNIINDAAWARITLRVAPGMDPRAVLDRLKEYIRKKLPWGLDLTLTEEPAVAPWSTDPDSPRNRMAFAAADAALERGYGVKPVHIGCGATIPFVKPFCEALAGAPALLVGVEDPYTNAHGENESLLLTDFKKACLSQICLFDEIARRFAPAGR